MGRSLQKQPGERGQAAGRAGRERGKVQARGRRPRARGWEPAEEGRGSPAPGSRERGATPFYPGKAGVVRQRAPGGLETVVPEPGTCTWCARPPRGGSRGSVPGAVCAPRGVPEQRATPGCGVLSRAGSLSGPGGDGRAGGARSGRARVTNPGEKDRGPREKEGARSESKPGASKAEAEPRGRRSQGPCGVPDPGNSQMVRFEMQKLCFRFQLKKGEM